MKESEVFVSPDNRCDFPYDLDPLLGGGVIGEGLAEVGGKLELDGGERRAGGIRPQGHVSRGRALAAPRGIN